MPVRERLLRSSRHVLDSAAWRPFRGGQKRPRRPSTAKLSTCRARKPPPRLHSPTPMRRRTTRSRSSSASAPWCALSPRRQRWRSEMATAAPAPKANMGEPAPRLDARAKVTGEARYASDVPINNPAYAFLLTSAIAKGRLELLDLDAARAVPGVLEIFTRENTAELKKIPFSAGGGGGATSIQNLGPEIAHDGQIIAMVVADSYEAAREGTYKIKASYAAETPSASFGSAGTTEEDATKV